MSELEKMGNILMETALNFTHPRFEDTYPEWSTVCNIGEELIRMSKQLELNKNQQIVLEWLKKKYKTTDIEPIELIWRLRVNSNSDKWRLQPPYKNYRYLTEIAQFQVLASFAEWGKKEVVE